MSTMLVQLVNRVTLTVIVLVLCNGSFSVGSRNKRYLVFPPQSIMQLATAVVTPAQVPNHMITTNMGLMFNIDLPTNVSRWYPYSPNYRKRRSSEESSSAFYSLLEAALLLNGIDGRACIQKSVCQMRETPLEGEDLPHKILRIIFGFGQKHTTGFWEPRLSNTTCDIEFPSCSFTPLDVFTDLFD